MKISRTHFNESPYPQAFFWDRYEDYVWNKKNTGDPDIFPTGQRLQSFKLDDIAKHDQLLKDFADVFNEKDALDFTRQWGCLILNPRMKIILAASAFIRWLLIIIEAIHLSDYDRILSWVQSHDEPDKAYGDVLVWLNTVEGRNWMRKTRCKYFPHYFNKLLAKSQSQSKKPFTKNELAVWKIYQTSKQRYGGQPYAKIFLEPTKEDIRKLRHWKGLITDANIDQTRDNFRVYMYLPKSDQLDDPKVLCYLARNYLRTVLNEMMRECGPALVWDSNPLNYGTLIPVQKIDNPWSVVCKTLFARVANIGRMALCPHPTCGKLYYGRSDKKHCGQARCARWVGRNRTK